MKETQYVLKQLNVPYNTVDTSKAAAKSESKMALCSAETSNNKIKLTRTVLTNGKMPDVKGMGARDAVYALQSAGLKVKLKGAGRVKKQSVEPGTAINKGITIGLELE